MASFFERHFGRPLNEFLALNHEQRASAARSAIPDLHFFFDEDHPLAGREAPARTRSLAVSLFEALSAVERRGADEPAAGTLRERIVTDSLLRAEADRDQNVYLGPLFTRTLTNALPDVIFQPISLAEVSAVFRWARANGVPLALRGAGTTAMGGSVPNDGGVTLDLSRLDGIDVDAADGTCIVGAGARLRAVHERLARRGLALSVYPSNLGGTLAGWFVSGGIGLNAFGRGGALDCVKVVDVVLPAGEHVRFHADGRLDAPGDAASSHRATYAGKAALDWFGSRGYEPITLADLAASEGAFGLVLRLTVAVEPRPEIGAFLLEFSTQPQALAAAAWISTSGGQAFPPPANVKLFSASHFHHVQRVWADEDGRGGRGGPSTLSSGAGMPWTRIAGPRELGVAAQSDARRAGAGGHGSRPTAAYLFVDFLGLDGARRFAATLGRCPGSPAVREDDGVRFAAERFRPQQTKRLGPGLLAAEVVLPTERLAAFLRAAERLAAGAGQALDSEIYFLRDGRALVIAGYLTDHRRGSFAVDLTLAPAITELAISRFGGRPYVLGRWQSGYFGLAQGPSAARIRAARRALDPGELLNRGVYTGLRLRGALGVLLSRGFVPGIALLRAVYGTPLVSWWARLVRAALAGLPGPAAGRGAPAVIGARYAVRPLVAADLSREGVAANGATAHLAARPSADSAAAPVAASARGAEPGSILLAVPPGGPQAGPALGVGAGTSAQPPEDRALHCVNCGECNSVCPIFHESKIRLPQMLTHLGEAVRAGERVPRTGSVLLDLCMRCGNCEEVCQAGIPHLPLSERLQVAADAARPRDPERHIGLLVSLRGSTRYRREFLDVREGAYLRRTPVALPGVARFVVLRSENDAGPAATCIHCAACVPVCPTNANREFEGADPRWVTTVQSRCIGCGSCVEVCPANHANGGRTLRVMETPTPDWFAALDEFERTSGASGAHSE